MTTRMKHQRQYQRRSIDVRVQLIICDRYREQVAPINGTSVPGWMTNISGGGAHVVVPTYLPRSTEVELEIPVGTKLPAGRVRSRIMKVEMVTREPHYGLGLRFEDTECEAVRALRAAEDEGVSQ
jgi:hypothetical protein